MVGVFSWQESQETPVRGCVGLCFFQRALTSRREARQATGWGPTGSPGLRINASVAVGGALSGPEGRLREHLCYQGQGVFCHSRRALT